MPTYQRVPKEVEQQALAILKRFECHKPLVECDCKLDILFAYPTENDKGEKTGEAIMKNGVKALGLARIINLKDRVAGRADAEILIDAPWWDEATKEERDALLDHELTHLVPKIDKRGLVRDDIGRPCLKLKPHDFEVGWFKDVATRHGRASIEQQQAREVMFHQGQAYWPQIDEKLRAEEAVVVKSRISRVAAS